MAIIKSLLDTDQYKFGMGQFALHQFSSVNVKYEFKCRNEMNWTKEHSERLNEEVKLFCELRFTEEELEYLSGLQLFKPSYIDFLRLYQPNIQHLSMETKDNQLHLSVQGPWFLAIYFEVPLLSMISEIYHRINAGSEEKYKSVYKNGIDKLIRKESISLRNKFKFADFGSRRRYGEDWQREIVHRLKHYFPDFVGTSNVMFAKEFDLKPIGTMAHEIFHVAQAVYPIRDFQKNILKAWLDEFEGGLGIALTDTIGIDAFLRDFDNLYLANAYNGVRHDSGCPYGWADKTIAHYKKLGIDPKTKTLVFSDSLDFKKCAELHKVYSDMISVNFGVGTFLTNDFDGITPLQIVMKIVECNGKSVAKISDSPGKGMCRDKEYVKYLKKIFKVNSNDI